ncbi:hypothetical protein GQ55_2G114100 [Panicum hallii var. hallii]|uniref:Uncharacterized protein n=1 Tax=Panicum hallii var. hallii TaxID=1504633 RepID=A0A2T7ENU8_9POAL|nr:hypothetical protein GQ55_2G114100 [Panicum hallii var. hallii]
MRHPAHPMGGGSAGGGKLFRRGLFAKVTQHPAVPTGGVSSEGPPARWEGGTFRRGASRPPNGREVPARGNPPFQRAGCLPPLFKPPPTP